MFSVRDRITDNVLQENLENATGLLVDKTRDTFHTATASETANSLRRGLFLRTEGRRRRNVTHGFSDTLNIVTENFTVALSTALAQTLQR